MNMLKWDVYSALFKRKIDIKLLFASLKTLPNSKNYSGSRIIISVPTSLSVIGRFSPVSASHWIQEKSA
jgi:hypothetical protein